MAQTNANEIAAILRALSAPLSAIVINAQAAQRIGDASGDMNELVDVLSDIAEDGRKAGELLRRLDAALALGTEPGSE